MQKTAIASSDTSIEKVIQPTRRIVELDALRGLAAIAVVGFHFTTRYEDLFGHTTALPASISWGHYGVDLFFMLSGFVILMSLERTTSSLQFAWGRLTRLYPAYWIAAFITFVVVSCVGLPGQEVTLWDALLNVTMVQALLGGEHIDGAYWSLQAELIFYFNMLLLYQCKAWRCFGAKSAAITVSLWVLLSLLIHTAVHGSPEFMPVWLAAVAPLLTKLQTIASLKFIPLFGFGILLYDMHKRGFSKSCFVAILLCTLTVGLIHGLITALVDIGLATGLALAIAGKACWLQWKPIVWLGAISYPLYLTHQNLGYVLMRYLEAGGIASWIAIMATTFAAVMLAGLLHEIVEVPSQKKLRKIDPRSWISLIPIGHNTRTNKQS